MCYPASGASKPAVEDSYVRAYPFDRPAEGMLHPEMVRETVEILRTASEKGKLANFIASNRAGGKAPLIAREIAERLIDKTLHKSNDQMILW